MPCRALEAFGLLPSSRPPHPPVLVLMPCRALEAFGHTEFVIVLPGVLLRLNALSGIGGVWTWPDLVNGGLAALRLNALSGIGGVWTHLGQGHRRSRG